MVAGCQAPMSAMGARVERVLFHERLGEGKQSIADGHLRGPYRREGLRERLAVDRIEREILWWSPNDVVFEQLRAGRGFGKVGVRQESQLPSKPFGIVGRQRVKPPTTLDAYVRHVFNPGSGPSPGPDGTLPLRGRPALDTRLPRAAAARTI